MIEIKNIKKIFNPGEVSQICVFNDFSLSIKDKSFVSIVGSNGSGKTSLLNIICGSIQLDKGQIIIDDKDITNCPEYERMKNIGRVHQNPSKGTCGSMNIIENMALAENKNKAFDLTKCINNEKRDRYRDKLKTLGLGLEDKCDNMVSKLSGGQRQALSVLMATMTPIKFLILDEHTAALDPHSADLVMDLTKKIIQENNLTALMVTHNLRYAVDYGNRLVMLHEGKVVIDKENKEKEDLSIEDVLNKFTSISIECGN
ncbi:MAG: ATP-binding cassette domain-containing protein [Eubacteriales bacterium]|nr:ATP-binding cassette domain-containing protein [Eubacteriales bacterium]